MSIEFASNAELATWDSRLLQNPDKGNIFQSVEFATQKELGNWRPRYLLINDIAITILEKKVPLLGRLWYLPKGPGLTNAKDIVALLPKLRRFAASHKVFAVKLEPELLKTSDTMKTLKVGGLVAVSAVQPNFSTILLNLAPSEDDIMASLNQKGRHAIHRAERDGVSVQEVASSDENCRLMYRLLAETAAGSFSIRSFAYYRSFWQRFSEAGLGQLLFAYVDGKVVAGAYGLVFGTKSTYKDGASIRNRVVYGASHLLQWHLLLWAKQQGALIHDFCGAPPSDRINDPTHPHYGIGRFKTSFSKQVTDYVGAYDLIVRPNRYFLWSRLGERVMQRLAHYFSHENFY